MSDAVHPDRAALVSNSKPKEDTRPRSRSRSRSPRGSPPRAPRQKNYTGLKWKQTERTDGDKDDDRRSGHDKDRRDRSYRSRDDRRDDRRDERRSDRRDDRRDDDDRRHDRGRRDPERRRDRDSDRHERPRRRDDRDRDRDRTSDRRRHGERASQTATPAAAAPPPTAVPGEPMIMVTVNDRLGTKAQIPCFASDPVKAFKMMVAAKIGRPVHEIMLKRQGERPFHDQLSLADYGVSNGVQIDLELNTGD